MLAGVMPRFQQWVHVWACGFMCLLFAGLCVLGAVLFVAGITSAGPNPAAYVLFGGPFAAFAGWAMVCQIRGMKTLVREFSYDGRLLRFRTIADSREHVRELYQIAEIRDGRSRGNSIGHCIAFRDGTRVYLNGWLHNGAVLGELLRAQLQQMQGHPA